MTPARNASASTPPLGRLCRRRQGARSLREDRGSATAELVLLIPVLLLMLWFTVFCSRLPDTRLRLEDAAHQATRAASQARSPAQAAKQARSTAAAALQEAGISCQSFTVATGGSLLPGSTVTVTLSCSVGLDDLALLRLPGATVLHARFAAPVDVHRGATVPASRESP
jgi:Flp pilus assembly protein TadG